MVEKVFSSLFAHMRKGIQMHDQLTYAFGFLNLLGYKKCQEYHTFEELNNFYKAREFFLENHSKLLVEETYEPIEVIPANWYKHVRENVDVNTKRSAIKDLTKIWVEWEKETKHFLEEKYKELYEMGEILCAIKVAEMIKEVRDELKLAREKQINLDSIGYDISLIVDEQSALYDKYEEKIKSIWG